LQPDEAVSFLIVGAMLIFMAGLALGYGAARLEKRIDAWMKKKDTSSNEQ
jgi:NhaP-type Na+/H+ or K+/H+ antiporter